MDASTIDRLALANVLVVGDVLLDRFVQGSVARISREAPVPVLGASATTAHPGGACNVAANIISCGGRCTLAGVVGHDDAGRELTELCASLPGMTVQMIPDRRRTTTVKTRYMSGWQQLLCVDSESPHASTSAVAGQLIEQARAALPAAGALVLSDYGRGALDRTTIAALIGEARGVGVPIIVDPRHDDPAVYRGATLVTPNLGEMERFTGIYAETDEAAVEACRRVVAHADVEAVLLTRGADGMTLVHRQADEPVHVHAETQQVFDVTGAGDTVVAVLAAALAAGDRLEDSVRLANTAAGIVVAKPGTAVVHPRELRLALGTSSNRGVVERTDAIEIVSLWKSLGLDVGFTNGCFDLLHRGHLHSLDQAAQSADKLVVGLNSDASTARLKGPARPVQDVGTRAAILSALRFVDLVVVFDEDTPEALIQALNPDVLAKGADYDGRDIPGAAFVTEQGGRVALLPLLEGFSTTGTIARIERAVNA